MTEWKNELYLGDNLDILREYVPDESVDLIYLDPPFNSNATYNVLFQEKSGEKSAAQITAFDDTWQWGQESEYAYQEIVKTSPKKLSDLIQAFRMFLGQNDMMAYLTMMAQRMSELYRVLKPTGSIYLHCDPTASHYLKLLMDAVFGANNYQNEIIWERTNAHNMRTKGYVRANDTIFYYTKSDSFVFNEQYTQYSAQQLHRYKPDENGRLFTGQDLTFSTANPSRQFEWRGTKPASNRSWGASLEQLEAWYAEGKILLKKDGTPRLDGFKFYLDEAKGIPLSTCWKDIPRVRNTASERLGYPTQKPEALLERIINASSNEGDLVLDPFCGCGTAIAVAERLHRRWIGIDITHLAITLMRHRLNNAFGKDLSPYEIIGQPRDLESARALAQESEHSGRYQFETWATGLVDAFPLHSNKKGADKGIDGYINFFDDNSGKAKTIIVQVKSGHVNASHIRDLKGVLERDKAQIGVYITLEEPTKPMKEEAISAGFYEPEHFPGTSYPKIQILTIRELLEGKNVEYPRLAPVATFKRAKKQNKSQDEQVRLV